MSGLRGQGGSEDGVPVLQPGVHASAKDRFSYKVAGNRVHVEPTTVGDPFAAGLRTWDDPMLAYLLRNVAASLAPAVRQLVPWALTTVSSYSPGSLGLFAPAGYSGPRATGLVGNLGHRTRASAFAAELVVAACLACRRWSGAGGWQLGGLRETGGRCDFGVKLLAETPGRSTVEADILVTDATGHRHAVDVKYSAGAYRAVPTQAVLTIIEQAIRRREIDSFSFVAPTRFRPAVHRAVTGRSGIHLVEGVWPSEDDVARLQARERQAVDYSSLIRSHRNDVERAIDPAVDAISIAYQAQWGSARQLVQIADGGFTYLFDGSPEALFDGSPEAATTEPAPRVVAGWGRNSERRQRGPALPPSLTATDRRHLIARSAGWRADLGLNLLPQDTAVNAGRGPLGRRWGHLEQQAAARPAAQALVRAVYDDLTDRPAQLEYLFIDAGLAQFDRFSNRPGLV
jgi:hypothetical protein